MDDTIAVIIRWSYFIELVVNMSGEIGQRFPLCWLGYFFSASLFSIRNRNYAEKISEAVKYASEILLSCDD